VWFVGLTEGGGGKNRAKPGECTSVRYNAIIGHIRLLCCKDTAAIPRTSPYVKAN
jgi:hypothetical protein